MTTSVTSGRPCLDWRYAPKVLRYLKRIFRRGRPIGLGVVLMVGLLIATPLWPSPAYPSEAWSERAIVEHVDQEDFSGTLDQERLLELIALGEMLFTAKFTSEDGVGRPGATQAILPTRRRREAPATFQRIAGLDANACSSCHNDPVAGGAGDFTANAFVTEGFTFPDLDTTDQQFSNERNTNHLMGAGLVELLAREMTAELTRQRSQALKTARAEGREVEVQLATKGVSFGRLVAFPDGTVDGRRIEGVDPDLVIRPFGHKGVMTSLRQFTINALNHHHGMQAVERFGARWTDDVDFDRDGIEGEITSGDVSALVAWQASRPPPRQEKPDDPAWAEAAERGSALFDRLGCASCHRRALPLETLAFADPGLLDTAGTLRAGEVRAEAAYDLRMLAWHEGLERDENGAYLVPLFADLKRHKMTDQTVDAFGNELLSQRFVERDVFQTTELWGVGSTGPYGHRGDMTMLDEAIRAHGGEGRASRDAYVDAAAGERSDLIAFLKTLVIQP